VKARQLRKPEKKENLTVGLQRPRSILKDAKAEYAKLR
jgi:hypothetical protein